MARARREQMNCDACGWTGVTAHGRVRQWLFGLAVLAVAVLVGIEWFGVTALGDDLWALGILIMLASLGLRLLVRGDRCPSCAGPAYHKKQLRRPPAGDEG
jgi:hypothetical protein